LSRTRTLFFVLAAPGLIGVFLLWKFTNDSPRAMYEKGKVQKEEYDMITASIDVEASEHGKNPIALIDGFRLSKVVLDEQFQLAV